MRTIVAAAVSVRGAAITRAPVPDAVAATWHASALAADMASVRAAERAERRSIGLAEMTVAVAREKMAREEAQLEASTHAEHAAMAQAQAQELYTRMRQVRR